MASGPAKVFIKIETAAEQQENLKNSRKTLKVLQRGTIDKENLAGRPILTGKVGFTKSKSEFDIKLESNDKLKRKKIDTKSASTQTQAYVTQYERKPAISPNDLTTDERPSEDYWHVLAEHRRDALDETLEENRFLHERIESLEEELQTSKQMLEEAKNLIDCLTDMLEDDNEPNEPMLVNPCPQASELSLAGSSALDFLEVVSSEEDLTTTSMSGASMSCTSMSGASTSYDD